MKNAFKILLIGVAVGSSILAIKKNTTINNLKTELAYKEKENSTLNEKLEHTSDNLNTLNQKNKKLSKRVVKEINKIISLKDSVNNLDENLKKDKKKLASKTYTTRKLIRLKKQLEREIEQQGDCPYKKDQTLENVQTTDIETTLMRKKNNGSFVKTSNSNKIDAIKTKFKILTNNPNKIGNKKINISVYDAKNKNVAFNDVIEIDYDDKNLDITSIIEVERKKIEKGTYNIIAYLDGKKINSTLAYID